MDAGAKYALLLLIEMVLFLRVAPQPLGAVIFWSVQAAQLTAYTVVTWRRTHLAISTLGGAAAAVASVFLLALYAAGYSWRNLSKPWLVAVCGLVALVPASVIVESRVHRIEWNEWKHHMAGMGLVDLLLLRHIPNLHNRGA